MSNLSIILNSSYKWPANRPFYSTTSNCLAWDPYLNQIYDSYCGQDFNYICEHDCKKLVLNLIILKYSLVKLNSKSRIKIFMLNVDLNTINNLKI